MAIVISQKPYDHSSQCMQLVTCDCQQLNQFYKSNKDKARAKPSDLMYGALNDDGELCAVLRLLPYDDFLFLRSVLTTIQYRGQGIASQLIRHAISNHEEAIYTLPTVLAISLYQKLGFQDVDRENIPGQLLASYRRFRQSDQGPTVMVINPRLG